DPNDQSHSRRTTHAFYRKENGEWWVKKLSDPASAWEYVGGSHFPMSKLRFGDFTGDGVTDVLAVENGRWAISESARKTWRELNPQLHDPVANLFIANMDPDDNIDDILRYDVESSPPNENDPLSPRWTEVIWWRSKNGTDPWEVFARYVFFLDPNNISQIPLLPFFGFPPVLVGRFSALSGGTLTVDYDRIGRFHALGTPPEQPGDLSLFPY